MSKNILLAAFDFDHTIIDDNSDIVARDLLPPSALTARLQSLHRSDGWTAYMQEVFNLLHRNLTTEADLSRAIEAIPEVEGMGRLLLRLHELNWETVIISDSNSYFIQRWLESKNLSGTVAKVYTNPSEFLEDGRLRIRKYHTQDWCRLSTNNLCKGHVLETHLVTGRQEGATFSRVAYIGDGQNDLCPALKLSPNDFVFPRVGYPLHVLLEDKQRRPKATVHPWSRPDEILKVLEGLSGT